MDIVQFRLDFPEFTDIVRYPDSQIEFWACIAETQVREQVWRNQKPFGVKLYVAHEITLASQNVSVSNKGGAPGGTSGPVTSKAVGQVNVSYDANQTAEKDAGWWNLTTYGKQFIRLARMFGAGAIQLSGRPYGAYMSSCSSQTRAGNTVALVKNDYSTDPVTTSAYVEIIDVLSANVRQIFIFDSSGQSLYLAVGAAGSEVNKAFITPGGNGAIDVSLPLGARVAIKAESGNATSGELLATFLG